MTDAIRSQLAADLVAVTAERDRLAAEVERLEEEARHLRADLIRLRAMLDAERRTRGEPVRVQALPTMRWVQP